MPTELRFIDSEGDGYWFKVEPVEKTETETDAVVFLTHSENEYSPVWLTSEDVRKLVEELLKYLPAQKISGGLFPNHLTSTNSPTTR